jgi:quinolinate synthase
MVLWEGACEVHENFSQQAIEDLRKAHPGAITLIHPECPLSIRALAEVVGSTTKLLNAV